ncbi:DUF5403 family protein [Streptomyces sp. NPDC002644]
MALRSARRSQPPRWWNVARVSGGIGRRVANMPGVNDAIKAEAEQRAARIRSAAAAHVDTGEFIREIKTKRAEGPHRRQDWLIVMNHPWSVSINWGHDDAKTGRPVGGIHVIERGLE